MISAGPVPVATIGELHRAVRSHHDPLPPAEEDPLWFQRAVFYEVLIRGFFDGNNDGVGDIPGLIAKLDYLQWLGVDCLWLLPFYPSPLRDGGYDISDYYSVHPESGTVDDLRRLIDEAHARGIRVIADLVINHTSDQNPWFIESRSSRDNPKADWYVWNDDDQRWPEARVVFIDAERSNWAYDPVRNQYYWHRFYSHQPDLNYENPEVAEAMLNVVRYWLDLGLDGFRLDAVPFLFQKDGTAGENLPETHAFIRRVRAELDTNYPGPHPAGRSQRLAGRCGRLLRRRRRVPSVLQLPPHAPAVHGRPAGAELPDHRDPGPDAGASRHCPVGHLLAEP